MATICFKSHLIAGHLQNLPDQQVAVAQGVPPFAERSGSHVAPRQKIAAQTVGNLLGVDAIVLLLRGGNGAQHQGMRDLQRSRMRPQVPKPLRQSRARVNAESQ